LFKLEFGTNGNKHDVWGMRKMILTKRQKELYDYIKNYIERYGYAPTQMEMSNHFNFSGNAAVHRHIKALVQKGLLVKTPFVDRGIELVKTRTSFKEGANEIPLIGYILEGSPIESLKRLEFIEVPRSMVKGLQLFALIIKGDFLEQEHIQDGDYAIFEARNYADNGEVAIIILKNRAIVVRKIVKKDNDYIFQADRTKNEICRYNEKDVKIRGVLVGLIRSKYNLLDNMDETR